MMCIRVGASRAAGCTEAGTAQMWLKGLSHPQRVNLGPPR